MRRTLTERIISDHLVQASEEELELRVDQILLEDATGTMACLQFEQLGLERVALPTVSYVDHNVLQIDNKNPEDHAYLRSWAARYGALYSRPGNGISHYLHLERFARPGGVLVGADSHTTMAGALGMLAIGAGATEVAVAMAGKPYRVERPVVVGVELRGELRPWVQSKDVVLELLRRRNVRGGRGRIFEFHGEGVATLSATDRGTICNMVMETGATTGIFPSDERTREWLAEQGRADEFVELAADPGAGYDEVEEIDLGELEPLIALPSSPGNVVPVREVGGTATRQVCVGSSVNSSYEDLAVVAAVLRGGRLPTDLDLTVTPGSRQILDLIVRSGVYADLLEAGARILEPACGPCIGMGQAPAAGAVSVRTFNRNFPGRSGTAEDRVYLCSPATAAATALRGVISDPRDLGEPPRLTAPPPNPAVDDRQIVLPPDDGRGVELLKGRNIVPPPPVPPLPEEIEGRVLIVVPDDVSTGDMAPDGALGLAIWSNIPACARYMFRRFDPEFPARAEEWCGGIVVGGHNYGQGSSREQAVFSALYLGVRAVVARSFARIHRTNLIAQGIPPLVVADGAGIEQGDEWRIGGVAAAVRDGRGELVARTPRGDVPLSLELSASEREILLAGGLIAYAKG
ncbi:MAG TPA: aconitate hydratase [Gaiellaceae bacterium]|nr:aconitate hydratase [Gaiellaceae bacterium]